MNKHYFLLLIAASALLLHTSCKKTEPETICCTEGTAHIIGETGKSIKVAPILSPDNLPFYDEVIDGVPYVTQSETLDETGRENVYANLNDNENDFFYIEGIEQFPFNEINFFTLGDTTPLFSTPFNDYLNKSHIVFDGRRNEMQTTGNDTIYVPKYLKSGEYRYKIKIFEDKKHQTIIDEVTGIFFIVRPQYPSTKNCK